LDYWTPTNTTASRPVPRQLSGINSNVESDRYLEDASYIRFRNLNIGYKFTKKTYNGLPVDEIRIYTQMQNLFTWTKFNGDPEVGIGSAESQTNLLVPGQFALYSYPTVQSFLFGLSINL
jgi:hypothetical protein